MIKYIILNKSMVVNYNDQTFVITRDDENYDRVFSAISAKELESIPDILGVSKLYEQRGIKLESDGMVYLNGIPLDTIFGNSGENK